MNLVGCTKDELKLHIESMFQEGMTWDNMGEWHVDHIIPMNAFDLSCGEQQRIVMWYKNLQPLWGSENLKKSDKYEEEEKQDLIYRYLSRAVSA